MSNERFVQVIYRIPETHRRRLNVLAAQQDISTTELVRRIFSAHLDSEDAKTATLNTMAP